MSLLDKWNKGRFSPYESEEKTVLKIIENITDFNKQVASEVDGKTDLKGDHKGSWQGLNKPTLSEEGMRATVEKINEQDLPTINSNIRDIYTNVKLYGAIGDGTTDESLSFISANNENGSILVPQGTYRISSNIAIGDIKFVNNGVISVDRNITLTVESVSCPPNNICFKGEGTIIIKNNRYSLGWYDGEYANLKWDFMRKGFKKSEYKYVYASAPSENTKGFIKTLDGGYGWVLNGAMFFNDNENFLTFDSESQFIATNGCSDMFVFSTLQKTEEIYFPKGLWLEGGTLRLSPVANNGIVINGGARIKFSGAVRCKTFLKNSVIIDNKYFGNDEIEFDFLEVTGFGENGIHLIGNEYGNVNTKIGYIFSNGALYGAENYVKIEGKTRTVKIDRLNENLNTSVGYNDVSNSVISLVSNTDGSPMFTVINDVFAWFSNKPIVKTINEVGTVKINHLSINNVFSNNATTNIDLSFLQNCYIENVQDKVNSIFVSSNCENVDIKAKSNNVVGNCKHLVVNGSMYGKYTLLTDTVVQVPFINNTETGKLELCTTEDKEGMASLFLRNGGALTSGYVGTSINITAGVLTGTTGIEGKINLSFIGSILYIENRTGNTKNIKIFAKV